MRTYFRQKVLLDVGEFFFPLWRNLSILDALLWPSPLLLRYNPPNKGGSTSSSPQCRMRNLPHHHLCCGNLFSRKDTWWLKVSTNYPWHINYASSGCQLFPKLPCNFSVTICIYWTEIPSKFLIASWESSGDNLSATLHQFSFLDSFIPKNQDSLSTPNCLLMNFSHPSITPYALQNVINWPI